MNANIAERRRWLGVALIVSLAVNAFFIGAAATDVFNTRHGGHHDKRLRFELRWLAGRLPDDEMAKVEKAVAADLPEAERHVARLGELRTGLGKLLADPDPDRAAIDAQLAAIRAELDVMVAETQKTTIDSLLTLPAGTRAGLGAPGDQAD
jgi:uncharacterized membrane protein